jgi:hypothetical protein
MSSIGRRTLNVESAMTKRVRVNGRFTIVEVAAQINLGLRSTHNHDGRFQRVWIKTVDGLIFRTSSYGGGYKPMLPWERPPVELR